MLLVFKHMKILIVDDDTEYRQALQVLLEGSGNIVVTANDGELAVFAYGKEDGIDLVITDYSMPKKNGLAVISEIRQIQPQARIWLISNMMDDETKDLAIDLGAEKSIRKSDLSIELRRLRIVN